MFESSTVNEPSGFEPLRLYCICFGETVWMHSSPEHLLLACAITDVFS